MGTIQAGKTAFTKVVFSADVPYVVADDASAQPDIRYVLDGREIQYDVEPRETRQSKVRSGDCKPIGEGTRVFLCRKSIPGHVIGEFSVNVGGVPFDDTSLTIETAREREVSTGFDENSPLARAWHITERIGERFQEVRDQGEVDKIINEETHFYQPKPPLGFAFRATRAQMLTYHLVDDYFSFSNTEGRHNFHIYSGDSRSTLSNQFQFSYWVTVEFFRLYFEDLILFRDDPSNELSIVARLRGSARTGRLNLAPRDGIDAPKTPIQREVAAAEAAGLVGNSPLVKAIRVANRIDDRVRSLYDRALKEEGGPPPDIFWRELPERYFRGTNTEPTIYFARFWMTLEYLRLSFEDPSASEQTLLDRFEESARQGRISLEPFFGPAFADVPSIN